MHFMCSGPMKYAKVPCMVAKENDLNQAVSSICFCSSKPSLKLTLVQRFVLACTGDNLWERDADFFLFVVKSSMF